MTEKTVRGGEAVKQSMTQMMASLSARLMRGSVSVGDPQSMREISRARSELGVS